MMKLRLRRYETRETLEFELANTSNLHDLCHRISSSTPSSVKRTILPEKVLLEKSGDESGLTTLATSVHAVMLESDSCILPELITKTRVEYVTVTFQSLSNTVVVYGSLGGRGCMVKRVSLNKNRFVSVIDLVVDTLKFEKQASCSSYRDVFTFWKMVKDVWFELPPCLMQLPTELKMKILELVPGDSVAKMACVCAEMRCLASDDGLWKHKCLEEAKHLVVNRSILIIAQFRRQRRQR
ncbi:hypothetical protein Bca52824_046308 [Brassica carinata]|uniref:F-box domain-containing protein n=1 Tax=Brassica carinata TaxID=52824 RepID=A0A8X7RJQ3_BRACI|nr:hypothetical protein Bca52824_046308 [Brassica carinata]